MTIIAHMNAAHLRHFLFTFLSLHSLAFCMWCGEKQKVILTLAFEELLFGAEDVLNFLRKVKKIIFETINF